jgi:hypothetical protein
MHVSSGKISLAIRGIIAEFYAHERMRKSAEMEKFIDPNQN